MAEPVVEFLSFEGCPLAPRALAALSAAIESLPEASGYRVRHVDLLDAATPEEMKRWGSPTILVNGRDITGAGPGDANSCRIYDGAGGVPGVEEIAVALLCSTRES